MIKSYHKPCCELKECKILHSEIVFCPSGLRALHGTACLKVTLQTRVPQILAPEQLQKYYSKGELTNVQTFGQIDGQSDIWTDGQTGGQTVDEQTDKNTD